MTQLDILATAGEYFGNMIAFLCSVVHDENAGDKARGDSGRT